MFAANLISKKRLGQKLTNQEISWLINQYVKNEIPDYQISALLMAIMFQGLDDEETFAFTKAFIESGQTIDLSSIPGVKVDKHSTGGIGDKVTLIVGPIMASLDVNFAKMSGSGLGYTGGTVDKLMSINGFNANLSIAQFIEQVKKIKISVISQSQDLVLADKKIYALRDVTDTVSSIPLITMSIMSKKIATGADALLLDVKCGNGAFMKDLDSAKILAQKLIKIGQAFNKDIKVEITNMDQPLGQTIGNRIEVLEAIKVLKNQGPEDLVTLVISSCATMLMQAKKEIKDFNVAQKIVEKTLVNGNALAKFYEWINFQGGNIEHLQSSEFWKPRYKFEVKAHKDGFLIINNLINFGLCALKLGGGRLVKDGKIDYDAGIYLHYKTGQKVTNGETLFTLYSSNPIENEHIQMIKDGFMISQKREITKTILLKM